MSVTAYQSNLMNYEGSPDWVGAPLSTGTSIMAVAFNGGVVIGADSRTSMGTYVANKVADKLTKVADGIYCCRSGSAADTQAISDIVTYHLDSLKVETGEKPLVITAAHLFQEICYKYRDSLSAGIIVAGHDEVSGGQVYCVPLGGMLQKQGCAIGGSGSTYIYGYVDATYKENMTENECTQFVTKALSLAMHRDGSSGGVVRLGVITKNGIKRSVIAGDDLPKI